MIDRRTRLLLLDMRDHARRAIEFLADLDAADLEADLMRLYAVNRAVEIVGEAAPKVDAAQRQTMPQIAWREAVGMRNVLIHGYDRVKVGVVVDTVRRNFPELIAQIEQVLADGAES